MSVVECFSFASVLLLTLVWAPSTECQSIPAVPNKYHVIVSANIVEKGYTLAYEEWYDGSLSMMRSDGRFSSPSVTQLIFRNSSNSSASTLTVYTVANTSSLSPTCVVCPLSVFPSMSLATMSVQAIFATFNLNSSVYLGTAPSLIRGIPCDLWQSNLTSPSSSSDFSVTANLYFSKANSVQAIQLPVRVEVFGTFRSLPFSHTYSFVAWSLSFSSSSIFAIPSSLTCQHSNVLPSISLLSSLPTSSTVGPTLSPNAPIPSLATSFQAWIETKVATPAALTSSLVLSSVSSIHYIFDMPNTTSTRKERVDFTSQYGQSVSILAQYQPMTNGAYYGEQWTTVNSVCTNVTLISSLNASPASIADVGIISSFFVDSSLLSTAVYAGRQVARGIPCDVWSVMIPSFTSTSTGVTYVQLLVSFYFFPTGWQFPGRNFPSNFRPLAAIYLNGNYASSNTAFSDGWDVVFLQTIDDTQLNNGGDPTLSANLQMPTACTNMTNSLFSTTAAPVAEVEALSSAGVAVAVVIGVAAGLAILFVVSRYWNKKRIQEQEKYRRTEKSIENQSL